MKLNKKYLMLVGVLFLTACSSKINTMKQNLSGKDLEAYYSQKTQVVCFTTSSSTQDNVYCLPAASVDTSSLKPDEWNVV